MDVGRETRRYRGDLDIFTVFGLVGNVSRAPDGEVKLAEVPRWSWG